MILLHFKGVEMSILTLLKSLTWTIYHEISLKNSPHELISVGFSKFIYPLMPKGFRSYPLRRFVQNVTFQILAQIGLLRLRKNGHVSLVHQVHTLCILCSCRVFVQFLWYCIRLNLVHSVVEDIEILILTEQSNDKTFFFLVHCYKWTSTPFTPFSLNSEIVKSV